jgi:hypothetical protein
LEFLKLDNQSTEYQEAKERFYELNEAFSKLKQLDKDNQNFIIAEIDSLHKQLVEKGLQMRVSEQTYTKTANGKEKEVTEIVLNFSIKPSEKIRKVLGKEGIGFKFNKYTNDWYIDRLDLQADNKNGEYLTKLYQATKNQEFDLLPDVIAFKNVTKIIEEPETKTQQKPKVVINPKLCYICQNNPYKTSGNYPTSSGSMKTINTCLSCSITKTDYIVQV